VLKRFANSILGPKGMAWKIVKGISKPRISSITMNQLRLKPLEKANSQARMNHVKEDFE
jgi:hypothetical protein